ncbi:LPS-assembly protein LptD [Croceicoccus marinus]|uniref:LPS-assembly protein LptD n=1 Tax=Croceicoccus marinus TaxID=450378 RepID=UPI000AE33DD8|nr:LPS assembly protein LptD [Croceicoccus marinus]
MRIPANGPVLYLPLCRLPLARRPLTVRLPLTARLLACAALTAAALPALAGEAAAQDRPAAMQPEGQQETPPELEDADPGVPEGPFFWDEIDEALYPQAVEEAPAPPAGTPESPFQIEPPADPNQIAFEADELGYGTSDDTVVASGNVVLRRQDQQLRADEVRWNRSTGAIVATGDIRLVDEGGNVLYTDRLELTDELRAGAMQNMLLVLAQGGRMAARRGERTDDGRVVLIDSAYSPCPVETAEGCAQDPSWRITADRVAYDPATQMIRFRGARLELFGLSLVPLPWMEIRADGQPVSGLVTPDLRISASNGVEVEGGYYWRIARNRELTLKGTAYTQVLPMASARYAALTETGAYQVTGYITSSSRVPIGDAAAIDPASERDLRGYLDANGRFQLSEHWSVTSSIRVTSDRTFLRRYDISRDDRLRSMANVQRIDDDSYLSFAGWATQTLRVDEEQGLVPMALPVIDYRRRVDDPLLGGRVMLQANTMALFRANGQDTQRAFAKAEWSLRRFTPWGQVVELTALARGDAYHSDENLLTGIERYRGETGWQGRGIALGAVDVTYPLIGGFMGGTQVLTPHLQLVATPDIKNLEVPNEDSRAIDLEDTNLFSLNRFPGYDRFEEGMRFTYGFDWRWMAPGWRVDASLGQSYRLTDAPALFPDGTGLTGRTSDITGRLDVRWREFVKYTHRFRVDKDTLAVRRNEWDVAVGTRQTYVEAGYLRLNRDIPLVLEDLRDREEIRLAGRVAFLDHMSLFGSAVINLTDRAEDPGSTSDGFEPLRTRLGIAYEDECIELGLTWRRDTRSTGDAQAGNSFLLRFRLKGIGFD